jgi:hypothetical protein
MSNATTFTAHSTVVQAAWLNDVDAKVFGVDSYGADPTGVSDSTSAFVAALAANKHVYIPPGTYRISEVELPVYCLMEGAGPYTTTIKIIKHASGTNRGLYRRSATEAEGGIVLKNFSLEAENYDTVGAHSYGLDWANIAHSYVENVHAVGFVKGFYLEDALINTFMRCRVSGCTTALHINGTEPFSSGAGANKNSFYEFKATSCTTGILIDGTSTYQSMFHNVDLEFNTTALDVQASGGPPHVFYMPYFEGALSTPSQANKIKVAANQHIVLDRPAFGNTGTAQEAGYIDTSTNLGRIEITGGQSATQSTRILAPIDGKMELVGSDNHDVAATSIMSMVDYDKTYTPIAQGGGMVTGPMVQSYIFGSTGHNGGTIRNTFDTDQNDTANWTAGTGTTGQTDPIGGTTAVALTGNYQRSRAVGASTGKVVAQAFVKVTTSTPGSFQFQYYNNNVLRATRIFSYSQATDWMLLWVSFDLTGASSTSTTHDFRIVDGSGVITIWNPQIVQGTDKPQPILPLDDGISPTPSFLEPVQLVGHRSYETAKIVDHVDFSGAAAATKDFHTLVDSNSNTLIRVFELVVKERYSTDRIVTVYNVALSYADATTNSESIEQVSQHLFGGGAASRCAASLTSTSANAAKTVRLTLSDTDAVTATIREIS